MRPPAARLAICFGMAALLLGKVAVAQTYLYLPTDRQTTGRKVRDAFNESAAPAGAWTVEVRRGKTQIALGLVVSPKGQVLTKLSQVQPSPSGSTQLASSSGSPSESARLKCAMPGGRVLDAKVIATDPNTDLALLKVEMDGLKTPELTRGFDTRLGRWVVTPRYGGAVTTVGIVSAGLRRVEAEKVSGVLGVQLALGDGPARIQEVFEDSGARSAGLKAGDVITRCNDREISDGPSLMARLRAMKPGEEVVLKVRREDKTEVVKATLTHPFGIFLSQFALQNRMGTELSQRADGFEEVFSQDGHVDPDECGGPLLDVNGRIVGINIARAGRTETLVLPVSLVERALERMQDRINHPESTNVSTEAKP
jgi:serine protease Do